MFSSMPALATSRRVPCPCKTGNSSVASTRSASPGCSSSTSEEVAQAIDSGDQSDLASRRGRGVLMLNELLMDLDVVACRGGSSDSSPSSLDSVANCTTRCTPLTHQMMSFSPAANITHAAGDAWQSSPTSFPVANQVAKQNMIPKMPMVKSMDASQRRPACAVAAAGDASRRSPIAKVSLGVAVIGGDASQRSPPGCTNLSQMRLASAQVQQHYVGSSMTDLGMPASQIDVRMPSPSNGTITGTSPSRTGAPIVQDASQRSPVGSAPPKSTSENCNETLKTWLLDMNGNASAVSAVDLVERLNAAAPETYED